MQLHVFPLSRMTLDPCAEIPTWITALSISNFLRMAQSGARLGQMDKVVLWTALLTQIGPS
jgi:hypothetical protein